MKTTESVWKVCRPDGYNLTEHKDGNYAWTSGTVRTQHGFVDVYAEAGFTRLSIIFDGYSVSRTFNRRYSKRGIVTLANRFIEEQQP